MKSWFRSKTLWVNVVIGIVGVLVAALETSPLDPTIVGGIVSVFGAANLYLRSITTTAIGKSDG